MALGARNDSDLCGTAKVFSCSCAELQPMGSAAVACPDPSALQIGPKATGSQQRTTPVPWGGKHRGPLRCLPASSSSQHHLLTPSIQQHGDPEPRAQGIAQPLQVGIILLFHPWDGAAVPPELGDVRQSQVWAGKSAPKCCSSGYLLFMCIHLQRFPLYMQARGVFVGGGTGNPGWAPLGEKPFPVGTPALASADALLKGAEQTHGNWQRAR